MDVASTSPKQNTSPFAALISPRLRSRSQRNARSPIDKLSTKRKEKNPFSTAKSLSIGSNINQVLVWTKLIEFSCNNASTESVIAPWFTSGWFSPNDATNKKKECVYRSKIEAHITCACLSQCLNYTFQEYMQYDWAMNVYLALIMQLTLAQKALLFLMANITNKTRISGKQSVKWMIDNQIARTRQEAVMLGHQFVDARYLNSTASFAAYFEDNDAVIYEVDANAIHYDLVATTRVETRAPQTPQSQYGNNIPSITMKYPAIDRFYRHNEFMQCLVQMTIIMTPNAEMHQFIDDIQYAFYLPSAMNNNRYVCKNIDYVAFNVWHEAIQFILTEFWEERYAQNIYNQLLSSLNAVQQCKLMSICVEVKTRKYRLKKYKDCFTGSEAINWLISARFARDLNTAAHFANRFCNKGLIKHITDANKGFKNDDNALYIFDVAEMDRQSTQLLWFKPAVTKFIAHEEFIQTLISMSISPMTEIELLLDLAKEFYLPRSQDKHSKFVSKLDSNLVFENIIEALHYMLMQKWEKDYSQIVYLKLLKKLSVSQKAKLFSIGIERKTKKKHFRKYKNCIVGNEACEWLINKGFCNDITSAIQLGNKLHKKGFIKHIHNDSEFKNEARIYQFDDIEINKQCIMESYKKRQSNDCYVDISLYQTEKVSVSESNNVSFPDIDYDVTDVNQVLSFEYKEKEKDELSFPDISNFQIQRTPPIKISQSKSKSSYSNLVYGAQRAQRHHEMNNLSVYSNIAVHGRHSNESHSKSNTLVADEADLMSPRCIIASITANTPEPHIDFGGDSRYFVSRTPVATPSDESKHGKTSHDSMATRISIPSLDEFVHKEARSLLPTNLTIDIHQDEIECLKGISSKYVNVDHDSQSTPFSKDNNSGCRFKFAHHIINSTASSDVPMDDNIFGDADACENVDKLREIETKISSSDMDSIHNPFAVSYNKYIPKQIGV